MAHKGNCSTIGLTVELFPIYAIRTICRKWFEWYIKEMVRMVHKGNCSTISLTVELFPIYAININTVEIGLF